MRANQSSIDFKDIAADALTGARSLLPELVPGGRFERDEYVALNPSRADKTLGSFKINSRTGLWEDFAIKVKGNDIIGWYAHAYGLKQGEAASQIAEKLGVSTRKGNGSKGDSREPPPKIFSWGEMGPPVGRDEIRRHSYPKNGTRRSSAGPLRPVTSQPIRLGTFAASNTRRTDFIHGRLRRWHSSSLAIRSARSPISRCACCCSPARAAATW